MININMLKASAIGFLILFAGFMDLFCNNAIAAGYNSTASGKILTKDGYLVRVICYDVESDGSGDYSATISGANGLTGIFKGVNIEVDETDTPTGGDIYVYRGAGTYKLDMLGGTGVTEFAGTNDAYLPAYNGSVFTGIELMGSTVSFSMSSLGAAKKCQVCFSIR